MSVATSGSGSHYKAHLLVGLIMVINISSLINHMIILRNWISSCPLSWAYSTNCLISDSLSLDIKEET